MSLIGVILLAALTRAEIVDRFRAPSIVKVDGLVQVRGECDAEMRREFLLPVAGEAAEICRRLYAADRLRERHFTEPGVAIVLGDVKTNLATVAVYPKVRSDGGKWTRILVPAPGFMDRLAFDLAVVRGYFRAIHGLDLDDAEALARIRAAYPELRLDDEYRAIAEWYEGRRGAEDDEKFLKLQRSVLQPGVARRQDVEIYASRLYLYPPTYAERFCGRFDCVSFREAIALAKADPGIRSAAAGKIREAMLFAGGRGERLAAAGLAYAAFLSELSQCRKTEAELTAILDGADAILKGVLDEDQKDHN